MESSTIKSLPVSASNTSHSPTLRCFPFRLRLCLVSAGASRPRGPWAWCWASCWRRPRSRPIFRPCRSGALVSPLLVLLAVTGAAAAVAGCVGFELSRQSVLSLRDLLPYDWIDSLAPDPTESLPGRVVCPRRELPVRHRGRRGFDLPDMESATKTAASRLVSSQRPGDCSRSRRSRHPWRGGLAAMVPFVPMRGDV